MFTLADKKNWLRFVLAFQQWVESTCARKPLLAFRMAFAMVWLTYDITDYLISGTQRYLWTLSDPVIHQHLAWAQLVLIFSQTGLLVGFFPLPFALIACAARGYEASLFALNDFLYYCVTLLILSQCDSALKWRQKQTQTALAWPRDTLILQTAWIYGMSAFLKLSPTFLSGGDLYVRQNYLATNLNWPYPADYLQLVKHLSANRILALMAVTVEFLAAGVLFCWWRWPERRRKLRPAAVALTAGIHGFGAIFLNVFFFGASLFVQVLLLTWEPKEKKSETEGSLRI